MMAKAIGPQNTVGAIGIRPRTVDNAVSIIGRSRPVAEDNTASLALLVFNRPLGFVAILGILALIGMIAKNAVILIVSIEEERANGRSVRDAVLGSATNRFRPMMLAAMSTVLGLLPIAPTVFWGPMAFAIMGGLLVATLLTLVFLPTVYMAVFGREDTVVPAPAAA